MAVLKDSRAQSRLEKAARERGNAWVNYEVEAKAIREKTARLRALRIAKETADKSAAVGEGPVSKKSVTKKSSNQRDVYATSVAGRSTKRWAARLTGRLTAR